MKKVFTSIVFSLLCFGLLSAQSFTDSRDGKVYKTVKIGNQAWMAENLKYNSNSGSWCYNNKGINCSRYGKLYDWQTAQNVCPSGWRLPSKSDFEKLLTSVGGSSAGADTKLLNNSNIGFMTQLGGFHYENGGFDGIKSCGRWWSSSEDGTGVSWNLSYNSYHETAGMMQMFNVMGYSVRCIKD